MRPSGKKVLDSYPYSCICFNLCSPSSVWKKTRNEKFRETTRSLPNSWVKIWLFGRTEKQVTPLTGCVAGNATASCGAVYPTASCVAGNATASCGAANAPASCGAGGLCGDVFTVTVCWIILTPGIHSD